MDTKKKLIDFKIEQLQFEKPFCYICKKDCELFRLDDKDWFLIVPENLWDKILCFECYNKIKNKII